MNHILFLSNGHGEDEIAAAIIKNLQVTNKKICESIIALPLVGQGRAFKSIGIELVAPGQDFPSGGFIMTNRELIQDIRAGLLKHFWTQLKGIWKIRKNIEVVVAVGDVLPFLLSIICPTSKKVFLSAAKSSYVGDHNSMEKWLMKTIAKTTFVRDEITSKYLNSKNINCQCAGNVMMDCMNITGDDFGLNTNQKVIGILPGSRVEAYDNFSILSDVITKINNLNIYSDIVYLVALAPSLDIGKANKAFHQNKGESSNDYNTIITTKFGDVVKRSDVIIGLAGTANEQSVGCGKPVIAFPGGGPQTSLYRFRLQSRMLGGAVVLIKERDPDIIASKTFEILKNIDFHQKVIDLGIQRMGRPGAASKIAEYIIEII